MDRSTWGSNSRRLLRLLLAAAAAAATVWISVPLAGVSAESQPDAQPKQHPALLADTKYWIRDTEFAERANWLRGLKPCTLVERISLDDSLVISLGDAMDSAHVRQMSLSPNGMLLLEEDTLESPDQSYISYLNESGDCFDSSSLPEAMQEAHWFGFGPHADELSWFNPANWKSDLSGPAGELVANLAPESHQIPCSEDMVVFGERNAALWPALDSSERSRLITFKVNFRPSEQMLARLLASRTSGQSGAATAEAFQQPPEGLRVSRLKIGPKSYTQKEFNQLARQYGDLLFAFADQKSVYNLHRLTAGNDSSGESIANPADDDQDQDVLTIDESSVRLGGDSSQPNELCLDEAGCQCGNEQSRLMEIICSFNQPLEPADLACLDPIRSAGYCNPICAASLSINMDPTRFSEPFLASQLVKLITHGGEGDGDSVQMVGANRDRKSASYYRDHLFVAHRRIDHAKFEITVRLVPTDANNYREIIGRDLEFAQLVKSHLDKAAIKSFYGIKSISIKSSVLWRSNSRTTIWRLVFIVLLAILVLATNTMTTGNRVPAESTSDMRHLDGIAASSTVQSNERSLDTEQAGRHTGADNDLAMVELDTHSIADSTLGLLID